MNSDSANDGGGRKGGVQKLNASILRFGRFNARSWFAWRLSQNWGDVPNACENSHAVSGVTPLLPRTISFTRWVWPALSQPGWARIFHNVLARFALYLIPFFDFYLYWLKMQVRNSSDNITPGCAGILFLGIVYVSHFDLVPCLIVRARCNVHLLSDFHRRIPNLMGFARYIHVWGKEIFYL